MSLIINSSIHPIYKPNLSPILTEIMTDFEEAVCSENLEELQKITLAYPSIVSSVDHYELLFQAACLESTEVLEFLLKLGLDPNAADEEGETPLFAADSARAVDLLVQYGADREKIIK